MTAGTKPESKYPLPKSQGARCFCYAMYYHIYISVHEFLTYDVSGWLYSSKLKGYVRKPRVDDNCCSCEYLRIL
jgi:hypothetical protein